MEINFRDHARARPGMYIGGFAIGQLSIIDDIVTSALASPACAILRANCLLHPNGFALQFLGNIPTFNLDQSPADLSVDLDLQCHPLERAFRIGSAYCIESSIFQRTYTKFSSRRFIDGVEDKSAPYPSPEVSPAVIVRFTPDLTLFEPHHRPSFLQLCGLASEWAIFHPTTKFAIEDEASQRRDYHYPNGLLSYAEETSHHWLGLPHSRTWHGSLNDKRESVEAVWIEIPVESQLTHSFVNGRRTIGGGTHVQGILEALAEWFRSVNPAPQCRPHGILYVSVRLNHTEWETSTRDKLTSPRAFDLCRRLIFEPWQPSIPSFPLTAPNPPPHHPPPPQP